MSKKSKTSKTVIVDNDNLLDTIESDVVVADEIVEHETEQTMEIDENGKIVLPGPLKGLAKSKPAEKKPKVEKAPKVFKGFTSDIFSEGLDDINNAVILLDIISDVMSRENIDMPYKISTYKNELRFSLLNMTSNELIEKFNEDELAAFNDTGAKNPKSEFISLRISK